MGSMLIAVQVRLRLTVGQALGDDYNAFPLLLGGLLMMGSLFATVLGMYLAQRFSNNTAKVMRFWGYVIAIGFVCAGIVVLLPDFSLLQVLYFVISAIVLGFVTIVLPPKMYVYGSETTVFYHLKQLWYYRVLLAMMVRYNIMSRYSQTTLGILWIMILPLSTALILSFVFSQIFRPIDIGDVPFISFFLVGLTFWNFFNQSITQSTVTIVQRRQLIGQVYFPRELLVTVKLGEAMVDLVFTFSIMVVINAVSGILPNWNYIFVPLLLLVQITFSMGIMLMVSYLSVMIRDIPNLVSVILQMLFYFTPILYTVELIPQRLRFIILFNPIAVLIDSYRTVIIYNQPPDGVLLFYPVVMSVVVLYVGYRFFKRNEKLLVDYA